MEQDRQALPEPDLGQPDTDTSRYRKIIRLIRTHKKYLAIVILLIVVIAAGSVWVQFYQASSRENIASIEETETHSERELPALSQQNITVYPSYYYAGALTATEDAVWIANHRGLLRFDKNTHETKTYSMIEGMLGTNTTDVVFFDGDMWTIHHDNGLSSPGGISRFDPETDSWRVYSANEHNLGRMANATFVIEASKLFIGLKDASYVYDPDADTFRRAPASFQYDEPNFTQNVWESTKQNLEPSLRSRVIDTELSYCQKRSFAGTRLFVIEPGVSRHGVAQDGDLLWYGCPQGIIKIDVSKSSVEFTGSYAYPASVYDVLAGQHSELLVQTNLGLGIINPETKRWTRIKESLPSVNGADFQWWNSAVWIEDNIYFLETNSADPYTEPSDTYLKMLRYNRADGSITDVTPSGEPENILDKAYAIVPRILRPSSDGKAVVFRSVNSVWFFTPSVPSPKVAVLDLGKVNEAGEYRLYDYAEANGEVWYIADNFLGRVRAAQNNDPVPKAEKIELPFKINENEGNVFTLLANTDYVMISGVPGTDWIYSIQEKTWRKSEINAIYPRLGSREQGLLLA